MQIIYCHQPDELGQPPTLRIEETEWTSRVAPVPFTLQRLDQWQFDQNESPTLQTGIDQSDYQILVAPTFVYCIPQVFTVDDILVGEGPALGIEEDSWRCLPAPVAAYPVPRVFTDDEVTEIVPPIPDEDFWFNAVAPVSAFPVPIVFAEEGLVLPEPPIREDDYWMCAVAPVVASNFLRAPDEDELPGIFFAASPPDVLGVGGVALVSGTGTVDSSAGIGAVVLPSGTGRVN